jgi:hypothetical protein
MEQAFVEPIRSQTDVAEIPRREFLYERLGTALIPV